MKTNIDENELSGELAAEQLEDVTGGEKHAGYVEVAGFSWGIVHQQTLGSAKG